MKKYLALTAILGSLIIFAPAAAEAKTTASISGNIIFAGNAEQPRRYYNRRSARVVNRTRIVRRGFRTYREVWQYRYQPNGRVTVRLISRTRIR
jgi:hypothetical protein